MKKLLFLLVLTNFTVFAQLQTKDDGRVFYNEVVETDKSIKEVHDAVEEFLATNSGNSNYTIKINNENQILSKGQITVIGPKKLEVVLNTEFKEGRYRILIDPISWNGKSPLMDSMNFDKVKAKEKMKQMYIEKGLKRAYERMDKRGEVDADIEEFIKMQTMLYKKSKEKIISFANSLKNYVSNKENSDW